MLQPRQNTFAQTNPSPSFFACDKAADHTFRFARHSVSIPREASNERAFNFHKKKTGALGYLRSNKQNLSRKDDHWSCQWKSLCVIFHSPFHLSKVNTSEARALAPANLPDQR